MSCDVSLTPKKYQFMQQIICCYELAMSSLNAIELRPVLLNKARGSAILENRKHISKRPTQSEKKSILLGGGGGGVFWIQ